MTEQELRAVRPDARSLRGLAHPVRLRMLGLLRTDGPATATSLAERLGLNSGATSYHLRQLAAHGFIVEDTERGSGRDRWWRAAHRLTNVDVQWLDADAGGREAGAAFFRGLVQIYTEHMHGAVEELPTLPKAWRGAGSFGDEMLRLSPDETRRLVGEIFEVVNRYRREDPETGSSAPADAAPVSFQMQVFPRPGVLAPEED